MRELLHFHGVVVPPWLNIPVSNLVCSFPPSGEQPASQIAVSLQGRSFHAIFRSTALVLSVPSVKNSVEDVVQSILSSLAITAGAACDFYIDHAIEVDSGKHGRFDPQVGYLRDLSAGVGVDSKVLTAALQRQDGFYLSRALMDLSFALRHQSQAAFFCYRAIETLMQKISNETGSKDAKAWEEFRAYVNCERSEIEGIQDAAEPLRHGKYRNAIQMNDSQMEALLRATWSIVCKFIIREAKGLR